MNATSYTLALSVLKTMHPEPAEHRLSPRGTLRDKALFKVEQSESLTVDHGGKSLYGCWQCILFGRDGGGSPPEAAKNEILEHSGGNLPPGTGYLGGSRSGGRPDNIKPLRTEHVWCVDL